MKITSVHARQVIDSRGNPTVEVEMAGDCGSVRAIVPSGASTGIFEAKELRDGGKPWKGQGVSKAVRNVNTTIAKAIKGKDFVSQEALDADLLKLDGTADKSHLGANALLGVSMAYMRLDAQGSNVPLWQHISTTYKTQARLPVIFANVINGGKHAGTGLAVQEVMVVPKATKFSGAVEDIANTYHALKDVIKKKYGGVATAVGDEGGFAPPVKTPEEALDLLELATKAAGTKMNYALDAASSEFYDESTKTYNTPQPLTAQVLSDYWVGLVKDYGIVSIEDPFEEHAFGDFAALRAQLLKKKYRCQIVGDDLTVTNPKRIAQAITQDSCDCLLLKVNQIGTITEAAQAARDATFAKWRVMVSHRSGETDDSFISHLAVGLGTGQTKIGAPCRGERTAKYNELLRISEQVSRYSPL